MENNHVGHAGHGKELDHTIKENYDILRNTMEVNSAFLIALCAEGLLELSEAQRIQVGCSCCYQCMQLSYCFQPHVLSFSCQSSSNAQCVVAKEFSLICLKCSSSAWKIPQNYKVYLVSMKILRSISRSMSITCEHLIIKACCVGIDLSEIR
jgi:hypothetical protein